MKKLIIVLFILASSLVSVAGTSVSAAGSPNAKLHCSPAVGTYWTKYCSIYYYPTGSYWVKLCSRYPDYCAGITP